MTVHATAVVDPGACLHAEVRVGPCAVVGDGVVLGAGCDLGPHAVISGPTELGPGCVVAAHATLGGAPQLRSGHGALEGASGEPGRLFVGARSIFREHSSVHRGSPGGVTRIGADNLVMAYAHVAHDCTLGEGNELANGAQLGGHTELGDHVTVGGLAALHQFVRVGDYAMIGGGAMVAQDVPPFCQVSGDRARVYGINRVGLKRAGYDEAARERIAWAVRELLSAPTLAAGLAALAERPAAEVDCLRVFAQGGRRGLCRPVW